MEPGFRGPVDEFVSALRTRLGDDSRLQERLAEVHHHLVEAADEYEAVGMSREEAEREALRAFGEAEEAIVPEAVRLGDGKSFFLIRGARSTRMFWGSLIVSGIVCTVALFTIAQRLGLSVSPQLIEVVIIGAAIAAFWSGFRLKRAGTWQIPVAGFLMTAVLVLTVAGLVVRDEHWQVHWIWQAQQAKEGDWQAVQPDVQSTANEAKYLLEFKHTGTVSGLPTTSGLLKYPEPLGASSTGQKWDVQAKRYFTGDLDQAKREWAEKSVKLVMSDAKIQEVFSSEAFYRSWSRMWDENHSFAARMQQVSGGWTFLVFVFLGCLVNLFGALMGQVGLWLTRWWGGRGRTA